MIYRYIVVSASELLKQNSFLCERHTRARFQPTEAQHIIIIIIIHTHILVPLTHSICLEISQRVSPKHNCFFGLTTHSFQSQFTL